MARSILSLGILTAFASTIAVRNRAFPQGSPPPNLAATIIALESFPQSLLRLLSTAAFRYMMFAAWECPAMAEISLRFRILFNLGGRGCFQSRFMGIGHQLDPLFPSR